MEKKTAMDRDVVSAMADGEPLAIYKKALGFRGRILVFAYNSITEEVEEIHLEGDPGDPECDTCYIELWTQRELQYFERKNKYHIDNGSIVRKKKVKKVGIKRTANNLPDEEVEELVSKPFMALKATVDKMTTEAALLRVIAFAEEAERPEKTMTYLKERLSLIQSGELELEE